MWRLPWRQSHRTSRGVCVQLGNNEELSVCFNPDTLTYDAVWKDRFLKFSDVRHGFMDGVLMAGTMVEARNRIANRNKDFKYNGFYRIGRQVVFSYRIGDQEFLDWPTINDGQFVRQVTPAKDHPLLDQWKSSEPQWPEVFRNWNLARHRVSIRNRYHCTSWQESMEFDILLWRSRL